MIFSKFLGSLDFCFFVPVLNLFQYQDKEVRKKSKINEDNTYKDSVLEISGFYSNESGNPVASYSEFAS